MLHDIFRGHTIKGGAGFLNVSPLVTLCHRTENLFDKLRNSEIQLSPEVMDVILEATGVVRDMFDAASGRMPESAELMLLEALDRALKADQPITVVQLDPLPTPVASAASTGCPAACCCSAACCCGACSCGGCA